MNVLVIDGQGGGVGKALVTALKAQCPALAVTALGTNATATAAMLRAGAAQAATGENAICYQCGKADIIAGVIGILHANALLGEISPAIASAVSTSEAVKVLIPMERCGLHIAGVSKQPLDTLIGQAAAQVAALYHERCKSESTPRKDMNP